MWGSDVTRQFDPRRIGIKFTRVFQGLCLLGQTTRILKPTALISPPRPTDPIQVSVLTEQRLLAVLPFLEMQKRKTQTFCSSRVCIQGAFSLPLGPLTSHPTPPLAHTFFNLKPHICRNELRKVISH